MNSFVSINDPYCGRKPDTLVITFSGIRRTNRKCIARRCKSETGKIKEGGASTECHSKVFYGRDHSCKGKYTKKVQPVRVNIYVLQQQEYNAIMADTDKEIFEQAARLRTLEEYTEWVIKCDERIDALEGQCRLMKRPRLSIGAAQSMIARIARLESEKNYVRARFVHAGAGHVSRDTGLVWREIDTAFESRVLTGVVLNSNYIEPRRFLDDAKHLVLEHLRGVMQRHNSVKVNTVFNGEFVTGDKRAHKSVATKNCEICQTADLEEWYCRRVVEPTLASLDEFQERDSGWALSRITNLMINVNKYNPMRAGCTVRIPPAIQRKNAVINVETQDNDCFALSVVAALYPADRNAHRKSSYPDYRPLLNLQGIEFPVKLNQIKVFERQNNISINVYGVEEVERKKKEETIVPLHITAEKKNRHVNLLHLQDPENGARSHYAWIKNLSRLVSSQLNKHNGRTHICDRCLHYFHNVEKLNAHVVNCQKQNECAIRLPREEDRWLIFKNFNRKERVPFVVYADIECILEKTPREKEDVGTYTYQRHTAFSIAYYVHCSHDSTMSAFRMRRDPDCIAWFVRELEILARRVREILTKNVPMETLTREQWRAFRDATRCHICDKPFAADDTRVRDHCHLSGRYRGPAHSECNINYKDSYMIPIVFHNLSGYDSHFIIQEIATAFKGSVEVLPITKEKYISFTKTVDTSKSDENKKKADESESKTHIKLRFIDSYKFLSSSLDKLASYLDKDKLQITRSQFQNLSDNDFALLTRKGVFPYEYLDCSDKLRDTRLPPRELFYSSLSGDTVSESDYAHAVNVWTRFSCHTLGEYSDLYLKTDVMLLTDIFENFRCSCIASYGLDPAYYYTLPGFTWDAMLKHTGIKFELLTDIDMLMFIERGIRGGLSQCSNRYAAANNKYMPSYNPSKPSSYLMYYDVNNLYGWAMCQPLPYAEFEWVEDPANFDPLTVSLDSPKGYVLEVDIEYPQELHDAHADLPFCPTRAKPPGKREAKLLATLDDKQRYVIHYRNLQQCVRHGLRVTKIHRVLRFTQSPWLKKYIELNTQFRTCAKNDFEKNLYKLMNNAVFGKTMENVRNHVDVKLVTKWDGRYGAEALIARPNFHSRSVFSENFVAIELRRLMVKFDKPIYVGMCILDISKVCLYEFHHEYMTPLYRDSCKIMYTDTDSLIYCIECDDVYERMKCDINRFDTSDYAPDNAYNIPLANKKVPGLMKDENNGAIMSEFVGLRAKMYALKVEGKKDMKKAKGVKSNVVARTITFDDYTRCLRDEIEMTRRQSCIRSKLHQVYTVSESKIALSPYDDKRFIVPGSNDTLPWGHYKIPT